MSQTGTGDTISFGVQTTVANGISGGNTFNYSVTGNNATALIDSNGDNQGTSASNTIGVTQTGNYTVTGTLDVGNVAQFKDVKTWTTNFDNLFKHLSNLESRLGEMDSIMTKLNDLETKVEKYRVKTPQEKFAIGIVLSDRIV